MTPIASYLASTPWSRHKLESILGVTFSGPVTADTKRLAWRLILDDEARAAVDRVRLVIPQAQVTSIHTT